MTADQIELWCERRMDALDARLMSNQLTQAQYDAEVKVLNARVEREYAFQPRA